MRFKFHLQAVLNLRVSEEHREELQLARLNQDLYKLDQFLEMLAQQRITAHQEMARELGKGLSGAEVRFRGDVERLQAEQWDRFSGHRAELAARIEKQRRVLEAARQKREVLENLSAQRQESYRLEQNRKEQKETDDMFLLRFEPDRSG